MSTSEERPNPDALLKRANEEQARATQGKLKVFFGFAPGVGKTYRMLQVARELIIEKKLTRVLVGLVETHRRPDTASLTLGLDLLPRKKVEYRGKWLEEFDLDAALARKPELLLLDELAHSNAAGSRHSKRWQDVHELLAAGIDVFTTVNVQHVESLNDIVAQITGIRVRETVPDSILERAEDIELVDIAPDELLQRLQEGKIYRAEQASRAKDHFFQKGNLLALRELALRAVAQHVDHDVREYREHHGVAATWPAGERILVCVGPAPSSGPLIRSAARLATAAHCPWVAAYVETPATGGLHQADAERLQTHLRLVESLGGLVARLSGDRISSVLLSYARKENVTRIVVGKPTHSPIRDRVWGSLLDDLVRGSGDIDVYVISGDAALRTAGAERTGRAGRAQSPELPVKWPWIHYALSTGAVLATTGVSAVIYGLFPVPDLAMLYLLSVMVVAIRLGRGPAIAAAGLSVAAYDFFFVPPRFTFAVADARYFLTFAMMFAVGLVVSELATRLKRQEQHAIARGDRTAALFALTRDLAGLDAPSDVALTVASHAAKLFDAQSFVLAPSEGQELTVIGAYPEHSLLEEKELGIARWTFSHDQTSGRGTDTLPGALGTYYPIETGNRPLGVLGLVQNRASASQPTTELREFISIFARQAAAALERCALAAHARSSALRAKSEEMRSSLLSAVSHDLRTPLATITGSATLLRDGESLNEATKTEMLASICDEASRLERLVANLLDMTRLDGGSLALKLDWVPVEELVGSALTRLETALGSRKVTVELPPQLPLVYVDPVLFGQVFINLFENAIKYTPSSAAIEVTARSIANTDSKMDSRATQAVEIEVRDHGPGLAAGTEQQVFEKFFRGVHTGVGGVGLGLAICRAIVEAHGGTIRAENCVDGGARFVLQLRMASAQPTINDLEERS